MPELPEVECIRQELENKVCGKTLCKIWFSGASNLLDENSLPLSVMEGQKLKSIERLGKYLLLHFTRHKLLSHLGMSGLYLIDLPGKLHEHLKFYFSGKTLLTYSDPRRFGYLCVAEANQDMKRWSNLGTDGISPKLRASAIAKKIISSKRVIKEVLLDQRIIAGIGNIYASEILFLSGITPFRLACELKKEEVANIVKYTKKILKTAIVNKGTTFSDYRLTNGKDGKFQVFLKVFQKRGEPCPLCKSPIRKVVIGGRSTFFCGKCQT